MIKPISTWTRTFYKLGYILRRVWPDDRDYSDNYAPLALEVLEERQMLSGFGGPGGDPFGGSGSGGDSGSGQYGGATGGGSSTGGNGDIIGGGSDSGPGGGLDGPGSGNHTGYSDLTYLTISDHWYTGIPNNNYAWNNPGTILGYDGQHAVGTTTGTFRTAEVTTADADLGLYFVTLATYQWTITITASADTGPGTVGGSGTANWYREHLSVSVSGDIIETTNLQIAEDFKTTGSTAGHSGTYSIAGHIVTASHETGGSVATYTYYVTKDSAGNRGKIEVDLDEKLKTTLDHNTSLDLLLDRSGYTDMVLTVSGNVQVAAESTYTRTTHYESDTTSTGGRIFQLSGSEQSDTDYTITFVDASLIKQTSGYTPVAVSADMAGQRRPMFDPAGHEIPRPSEGMRLAWEMNGTKSWTTELAHQYSGNGTFAYVSDTWIRVGEITSQYEEVSTYNNEYTSNVQHDETMLDVTRIFWVDTFGREGYSYVKVASDDPPIQYVALHSRSETVDNSDGQIKVNYALKRAYLADGKVLTTTESVIDAGVTKPSFVWESHNPDLKTDITSAELVVSQSIGHDQTDFNYTSEEVHLSGDWNRTAVYNTTNQTSQISGTAAVFTGTVAKTGTKNLTTAYDSQSVDSRAGWKQEFNTDGVQAIAINVGDGSIAESTPIGSSTLINTLNSTSGVTRIDTASHDFRYEYLAQGEVVVADKSTITSYTTRLSSTDVETETTLRDTEKDGTTVHYQSNSNNTTTVTGHAISAEDTVQPAWGESDLQAIKSAIRGEASRITRDTTTTFTPVSGSQPDDDLSANAVGDDATAKNYEVDISGTDTVVQLSKISTTTRADGLRLSDVSQVTGGQDGEPLSTTVEFSRVTWDHTNGVEVVDSSTYAYLHTEGSQSYSVEASGVTKKSANIGGISSVLKLDVIQTGAAVDFGADFGINPLDPGFRSVGSTFDVSSGWLQARDAIADSNPADFPNDFLISMSVDLRNTTEASDDQATHEFNYKAYYEMGLVPASDAGDESGSDQASATVADDGTAGGDLVPGYIEASRVGRTVETAKSSNGSWDNGFDFQYRVSRISSGTYSDGNLPGSGHVEFAYSFARTDLAPGQENMTQVLTGKKTTTDHGTYNGVTHLNDGKVIATIEGVSVEGLEGGGVKTSSAKLQTRQNEIITKKWENNLGGGNGQITLSRLVSLPIDGPNYSETESATVTFNNLQTVRSPGAAGNDDSGNQNGQSSQGGGSSQSSGSGQSSQSGGASVESLFDKIRDRLAQRSSPEPGVDVTGATVTSGDSSFMFAESWTREVARVYAYPAGSDYHFGASVDSSSAERTTTNTKNAIESVTFLAGASYTIHQLDNTDKTEIVWNNHAHNRHFHSQTFANQVPSPIDVPSLPSGHVGTDPAPLLSTPPAGATLVREYISHMNYDSPANSIVGETTSEITQPFTFNPELNNKILYRYTRTLDTDAGAEAVIRSTEQTDATFTSTKTEFSETNTGDSKEVRQMHAGAQGGFVESVEFNDGTGSAVEANIVVRRLAEFNYIVTPQGTVALVPEPIYVYSSGKPTFFDLSDPQDKKLLLHVKEFAGIVASNETGFAPAQSAEGSYPSGDQAEGQVADDSSWVNSITRIIQLDLSVESGLAFTQAFAAGFAYDGLMGTLSMLWDTATWGWDAVWFAGTYVVGGSDAAFGTEFGQGIVAAGQSMEQSVYAAMEFGQTFYAVANDLPKLLGYASGALSNETQQVLDQVNVVLQELLPQILAELAELPQQEKAAILGQIAGMITYEITLTIGVSVATAGVGAAVSAAAAAGKFCKWARKLNSLLPEPIAKRILPLIAKYIGCFEGPTSVTQYSVQGDLSQVTLAATVDLDVPAQESRLLSDGQWAAVGLGLVVALSCRALSRKAQADQEPEDDPWKVQYHYAA